MGDSQKIPERSNTIERAGGGIIDLATGSGIIKALIEALRSASTTGYQNSSRGQLTTG